MAMIYCRECGYKHSDKAKACPKCGYTSEETLVNKANKLTNGKSIVVYLILAWFFGIVGGHRFYAGKTGSAIAMLLMSTVGFVLIVPVIVSGIWALVDIIVGICNINTPEKIFTTK
jgi:TM2 domain-containing membrane protein YozV